MRVLKFLDKQNLSRNIVLDAFLISRGNYFNGEKVQLQFSFGQKEYQNGLFTLSTHPLYKYLIV